MPIPVSELVSIAMNGTLARVTLRPFLAGPTSTIDPVDSLTFGSSFSFQYWPESISDDKEVNYATLQPIGGSHPIYQWISSGARTISFQAIFTNEIQNKLRLLSQGTQFFVNPLLGFTNRFSVDIPGAVAWLRQFLYPIYEQGGEDIGLAKPPLRLLLTVPGTNLGRVGTVSTEGGTGQGNSGGDIITVIMTRCGVNYQAWFPDGTLKAITVDLSFVETVQKRSIRFVSARDFRKVAQRYRLTVPVVG